MWRDNGNDTISLMNGSTCCNKCDNDNPFLIQPVFPRPSDRKLLLVVVAMRRIKNEDYSWKFEDDYWARTGVDGQPYEFFENALDDCRLFCDTLYFSRTHLAEKADAIRDIIENPFQTTAIFLPPLIDGRPDLWEVVRGIAEEAYDPANRIDGALDPQRLLVLSDAMEEAGTPQREECWECGGDGTVPEERPWGDTVAIERLTCQSCEGTGFMPHNFLAHLRRPGVRHWPGCYVVDLLLGKV